MARRRPGDARWRAGRQVAMLRRHDASGGLLDAGVGRKPSIAPKGVCLPPIDATPFEARSWASRRSVVTTRTFPGAVFRGHLRRAPQCRHPRPARRRRRLRSPAQEAPQDRCASHDPGDRVCRRLRPRGSAGRPRRRGPEFPAAGRSRRCRGCRARLSAARGRIPGCARSLRGGWPRRWRRRCGSRGSCRRPRPAPWRRAFPRAAR